MESRIISGVVEDAGKLLKARTLGGVTKESAAEAIQKAADGIASKADDVISAVKKELEAFKGKTAQEMAELTSQKDKIIFKIEQNSQRAVKNAEEQVKQAKAIKRFEKTLENGNTEIRKVNKNGASMVKEVNPNGVTVKTEVTTLAGDYKKTTYDPVTGKPIKTFSNINGDKLTEYTTEGNFVSTKAVNAKKVKKNKPHIVSQSKPKYVKTEFSGEKGISFERHYSDGSVETITRISKASNDELERIVVKTVDSNGNFVSEAVTWAANNEKRVVANIAPNIRYRMNEFTLKGVYYKYSSHNVYDKSSMRNVIVKGTAQIGDTKTNYTIIKDEYGLFTDKYRAKTVYPKGSGKKPEIKVVSAQELARLI